MDITEEKNKISDLAKDIDEEAKPLYELLPAEIFSSRSSKFSQLINDIGTPQDYKLSDIKYTVKFRTAIYFHVISISPAQGTTLKSNDILLTYKNIGGKETPATLRQTETGDISTSINDAATEITISLRKSFILKPKVTIGNISIYGWTIEGISNLQKRIDDFKENYNYFKNERANLLGNIESIYSEALTKNSDLTEVNQEMAASINAITDQITEKNNTLNEITADLIGVSAEHKDKSEELANFLSELNEKKKSEERLADRISQQTIKNEELNAKIASNETDLKDLLSNRHLFAENLKGYSEHGAKSTRIYLFIAAVPIALLLALSINLYYSSGAIVDLVNEIKSGISITNIILAKLPYTLISLALIQASYMIAHTFISKAIALDRDRLQLSKISVLAREASDSSLRDVEIPYEVKYQHYLKLKITLLKEYMAKNIDDYSHDPDANLDPHLVPWYHQLMKFKRGEITKHELEQEPNKPINERIDTDAP